MGNLSEHFSRAEFACKDGCGFVTVDAELLELLEHIREEFGPVTITSGCRCEIHNTIVGASINSQHLRGRAADFKTEANPRDVYHWLSTNFPNTLGLGRYDTFTHVDTRNGRARW